MPSVHQSLRFRGLLLAAMHPRRSGAQHEPCPCLTVSGSAPDARGSEPIDPRRSRRATSHPRASRQSLRGGRSWTWMLI